MQRGQGETKIKEAPHPVEAEFPKGIAPIPLRRQGAAGVGTSGISTRVASNVEE